MAEASQEYLKESVAELEVIKTKVGMVLGMPFGRKTVRREWAIALGTIAWPLGTTVMQAAVFDQPVSQARELICQEAISREAPYVWFIDDDTIPTPAAPRMLVYALEQNPDAIACGGIYCSKTDPPQPMVFQDYGVGSDWNWKVGEVFECKGLGTGCMMIRTSLLKNLPQPWFKTVDVAVSGGEQYMVQSTDDIYFCKKAVKAGYKILAHGGVLCAHWDMNSMTCYELPKDSRPYST